ncbi:subtilisin-like protease, putative [Coccidioides posadasii C735 delta SOWgp]|uniref:Subtilisin-like protease CPC735_035780 n=1 Tax=Coccidioides posadasii (strain C735) TaxID=222929 RepID=SU11A_COCP7|nr:subtilisin-like protease, putative [Coccidioides posadasii C735 delta SOWgp]C5P1W9.1 RecName: Full=Subtilisin-like protease CPC735_035780; Flags: Precursor [Coccidioides posadasii C735 delta SOWgp]EER28872.1 subtilisin-like protease, putative [Coccidioides posadasii C735 delta SOWgp]|eukprot:XP_003071017.1 subtilisin-like protease, putative [Coccidioides posadasii C735 delta SOWgp]
MSIMKIATLFFAALSAVEAAKLLTPSDKRDIVPDSYIVVMKDNVSPLKFDSHMSWATNVHHANLARQGSTATGGLKHVYRIDGWQGYSGSFARETIDRILENDDVDYVEPDRRVHLTALTTQPNAPSWGLGRISHRNNGNSNFVYDDRAGEGITFYGVDTGIDINHPDFGGRAVWGTNTAGGSDSDGHGHGTHTAGTVAGASYGIAKKAKLVAVKVLSEGGTGQWSGIIEGINWSVNHARANNALGKAVMNMSLGGRLSTSVNQATTRAQRAGIFIAVAAGNEDPSVQSDAANTSPASAEDVCTVAASTEQDGRASFSNWGSMVEIYAPGTNIVSTTPGGNTGKMSGTSMAAPHVAGVGAAIMASEGISPSEVCSRLVEIGLEQISNPGSGTTNKLLYNNSGR